VITTGYWVNVLAKTSIFDAVGGLGYDRFKCRASDNVFSNDSVAGCHSPAGPGQVVAHYWDVHFIFVTDFFVKGGILCEDAHAQVARKILHRLVRGMLQSFKHDAGIS
jgi:hypothetical protein